MNGLLVDNSHEIINLIFPESQERYGKIVCLFLSELVFEGSLMFFLSCVCYAFVCICLYVPCGQLLGKG